MPFNNVEDGSRDQHFHEPGEVVGVDVGTKVKVTGSLYDAINLACPRGILKNSEQSEGAGKEQHTGAK